MVRPFIFPALTIWGTRGTLVLCLSERQPFFAALTQRGELRSAERGDSRRPSKRGTAVGLPLRLFREIFAVHRQRAATHNGKSKQARHNSVAQFVSRRL